MFSKHKRIKDKRAIQSCRRSYCEICGAPANIEPHHIFSVGAGGCDIVQNLIQLCTACHIRAHAQGVDKNALLRIVAWREAITEDEVYAVNRRAMGYKVE